MSNEIEEKKSDKVVDLFRKYLTTKKREGHSQNEVINKTFYDLRLKLPTMHTKTFANQALGLSRLSYDVGIPLMEFLSDWDKQQTTKQNETDKK